MRIRLGILRRRPRSCKGQSLALMALIMPVLIRFLGLAIDYGRLAVEQRKLQNAADAAALAGVPDLPTSTLQATTDATSYLASNSFTSGGNGASYPGGSCCSYSKMQVSNDTITVSLQRSVSLDFMSVLPNVTNPWPLKASAKATDWIGSIGQCDTSASSTACFPYIVWNTHGTSCTVNQIGDIVLFHDNSYASNTGATSCGWSCNSDDQKGFLRPSSPLVLGSNTTKGGNACGQEPDAELQTIAASSNPIIWLPVVNSESGNGSNIVINVMGFVALDLSFTYPQTDTNYPNVVYPHPGAEIQPSDYTCPNSFFGKIVGSVTTVPTGGTKSSGNCTATPQESCIQRVTLSQ